MALKSHCENLNSDVAGNGAGIAHVQFSGTVDCDLVDPTDRCKVVRLGRRILPKSYDF